MKIESKFNFFALALGSLKFDYSKKISSHFMESKNTTNFEAKTDKKIHYPPNRWWVWPMLLKNLSVYKLELIFTSKIKCNSSNTNSDTYPILKQAG